MSQGSSLVDCKLGNIQFASHGLYALFGRSVQNEMIAHIGDGAAVPIDSRRVDGELVLGRLRGEQLLVHDALRSVPLLGVPHSPRRLASTPGLRAQPTYLWCVGCVYVCGETCVCCLTHCPALPCVNEQ